MTDSTIAQIHQNKTGKVSDKWASYLTHYDKILIELKSRKIKMLEIGVGHGGSIDTWREYFSNAELIIGCDIDPKCSKLQYDDPKINVVVGDANSNEAYAKITSISNQFDLIIDDGSHRSVDILNSFINYFPLLKPSGIFVIEDTHTLYQDPYGGGILTENGPYAFFKKIVDVINFQFWKNEISIQTYLRTFFPLQATPNFILEGWIESIEFKNSMITIYKATQPGHDKVGRNIRVGTLETW